MRQDRVRGGVPTTIGVVVFSLNDDLTRLGLIDVPSLLALVEKEALRLGLGQLLAALTDRGSLGRLSLQLVIRDMFVGLDLIGDSPNYLPPGVERFGLNCVRRG